jgi:NAD(P)-dependent dehydrogenase (short-subunit alcohol dehydrogenase family)
MSKQLPPRARAVVTGAGSGFGRAVSLELAARGARVLVTDLDLALAEETAALVAARGGEAHALAVDVTDAAQVEAAAIRADQLWPRSPSSAPLPATVLADYHRLMNLAATRT